MMISASTVVKVISLPGVGRRTAFKLLKSLNYSITDNCDLRDFIRDNSKLLRNQIADLEIQGAFDKADIILDKSEHAGIKLVSFFDDDYPILLKGIDDPALLLSVKGPYKEINHLPSIAIIGTRGPSEFGYKIGVRLGEVFGEAGFNVVSGLAVGCDTAGHTGCLNKNGFTTAVLAHGLDTIYPKENKQLAAKIVDSGGLLISEYLIGQRPQANYFVERDRIQAGLSQAIIVVETDIKGGTMHTVKFASNNKRIVAAFNHEAKYLSHPKTQGNQYLIKNRTAIPLSNGDSIDYLKKTLLDLSGYVTPKNLEKNVSPSLPSNTKTESLYVVELPKLEEKKAKTEPKSPKKNAKVSASKVQKSELNSDINGTAKKEKLSKTESKNKAVGKSTSKVNKANAKASAEPSKNVVQLDISFQ